MKAKLVLKELPARSRLEQYEKQATDLLKAYRSCAPETMYCIRQHHPRLRGRWGTNDRNSVSDSEIQSVGVSLADAQAVVARWHGFESWPKLEKYIQALNRKDSLVLPFELALKATITGDIKTLKRLLRENPELARARSARAHHATLLHYVAANGVEGYHQKTPKNAVEIAKVLLAAGAEVDADLAYRGAMRKRYPERGGSRPLGLVATSFHPAKAGVQIALLETLLDAGAGIDGAPGGWNPLIAALHNGRGEAAEFLARRGARLDLEGAAGVGRLDVVKSFFNKAGGLKAGATKAQMETGFAWACEYGRTRVVDFLLQKGLDVAAQPHGETGLHWAAYGGHSDLVRLLLRRNAAVDLKDKRYGAMPLGWALHGWCYPPPEGKRARYHEVVALLVASGAKVIPAEDLDRSQIAKLRADSRMRAALRGEMTGKYRAQ
jgi:ankyrin repeat protein